MRRKTLLVFLCSTCLSICHGFAPLVSCSGRAGARKSLVNLKGPHPPLSCLSSFSSWRHRSMKWPRICIIRRRERLDGLRMGGKNKEGPPPIDFSGMAGFGEGFLPADFLAMHEMIVGATAKDGSAEEIQRIGAAMADEIQRTYMLSVCAFAGAADYARKLSIRDESAALKLVRSETLKLPQEEAIMQIYPEQGKIMAQLVLAMGATKVLEIGTFTGYSSTSMASSLPPGGKLVCCDVNEDYVSTAKRAWEKGGMSGKIDLRMGPALDTINELLDAGEAGTFDAVFIDADKVNSDSYYEASLRLLRDGGVVMIDDSLWSGRVMNERDHTDPETVALRALNEKVSEDPRVMASVLPVADGVTLAVKMPQWAVQSGAGWGSAGRKSADPVSSVWSGLGGRVIAVEGNIAAGKSTLINGLSGLSASARKGVRLYDEVPDEAMLAGFYRDPKVMGFAFQVHMLNKCQAALRSAHEERRNGKMSIIDRSVWGNRAFALANHRINNISPEEFKAYEGLTAAHASSADLILYLDVPPHVCASRCSARGRDCEKGMDEAYLNELDVAYFDVVIDAAAQASPNVLVLDWRDYGREQDVAALMAACLRGAVSLPKVRYAQEVAPDVSDNDTMIDTDKLREMNAKRLRAEEFLISDFRAGPRTFLQVLAPMLAGGAAMGLSTGIAQSAGRGRLFVVEPHKGLQGYQELEYVFRRAVLHGLSRLMDVTIVCPRQK